MNKLLSFFFLVQFSLPVWAQYLNIPVGSWREHLPMSKSSTVAQSSEKVYCATEKGIIVLRKDDNSFESLGRSGGLSDINISSVGFHEATQTLVVGFRNGNIDLVKNNEVANLGDLKRTQVILGSKAINRIKFLQNNAYLCTDFGILVLDMIRREVKSTYYPTPNNSIVYDVDFRNDTIYAATAVGVLKASLSDPGIAFYTNWQNIPGFGPERPCANVAWYGDELYINRIVPFVYDNDTIFKYNNGAPLVELSGNGFQNVTVSGGQLLICQNLSVLVKKTPDSEYLSIYEYNGGVQPLPNDAIRDLQDPRLIWIADMTSGLVGSNGLFDNQIYKPEGPISKNVFRMQMADDQLWVATGGYNLAYNPLYQIDGLFNRDGALWKSYRFPVGSDYLRDMVALAVDPADSKHVFAATWDSGLAEIRNGALVKVYDTLSSTLDPISANSDLIRTTGLAFDKKSNLWAVTSSAQRPVAMKTPNGTWKSYAFSSAINDQTTGDMMVDSAGQKWFVIYDKGLVVFKTDENEELESYRLLNDQVGNGALNSNKVLSVAQDLEGLIWVGTSAGVNVFYSPEAILAEDNQGNWDSQKITVAQGGFNQYLLNSEEVTCIAVDGANRKWFGTRKAGLFLVSPDGTEQIANFDFDNSPLLSNTIISLCMDYRTGELFIGTDQGLCSFRTDATLGDSRFGKMYAFPNPVRPEYTGLVTITGMVAGAEVKITDVEGNVVFSGKANGGTITWDGRRYSGERAATGVYMIFATNSDGSQTKVTKLLFVN